MEPSMIAALRGKRALVTTDDWFWAPDGNSYKAVWGTLKHVYTDAETLEVKTNARSTNWYLSIGDMLIAGCQVHYLQLCETCSFEPPIMELVHELDVSEGRGATPRIWNADNTAYQHGDGHGPR